MCHKYTHKGTPTHVYDLRVKRCGKTCMCVCVCVLQFVATNVSSPQAVRSKQQAPSSRPASQPASQLWRSLVANPHILLCHCSCCYCTLFADFCGLNCFLLICRCNSLQLFYLFLLFDCICHTCRRRWW